MLSGICNALHPSSVSVDQKKKQPEDVLQLENAESSPGSLPTHIAPCCGVGAAHGACSHHILVL